MYLYTWGYGGVCAHVNVCASIVQKRGLDTLKLQLQVVVNCLAWMLGIGI